MTAPHVPLFPLFPDPGVVILTSGNRCLIGLIGPLLRWNDKNVYCALLLHDVKKQTKNKQENQAKHAIPEGFPASIIVDSTMYQ